MSTTLFNGLCSVSRLAARASTSSGPADWSDIREQAQEIELDLQSWEPEDLGTGRQIAESRAAAIAMQWALLLRLKQKVGSLRNDDPQITKAADNILSALSLIRSGSEVEAHILFPLFMAGVGSMTKANRLIVEYRLNIMETTVGFGNIVVVHKILDELWRLTNEGEVTEWEHIMRTRYPGLVLF